MPKIRPDPEKLLHRAQEEEQKSARGKLKIYLGAGPGVGKTHAMLQDGLDDLNKELDVVIGIVESHGRKEIDFLTHDFEILPRKIINYRERQIKEFDIDAVLKRHPAIVLIDEMAHTNAPESRHQKRWQDIEEILNRGIDVYTTLNVQHIESLSDDVSQIIHAPIRETVPDFMLDRADMIELVDITPEELLSRLKEGKVYYPEQAEIAAENFFQRGNLIALRELALRTAAQHVESDVLLYRQDQGIQHVWPTNEKILVCVGPGNHSPKLIRAAKRLANSLKTDWIAVYVETPALQQSLTKRNSAIQNLKLAEQLGAETKILSGFDIIKEIMQYAREKNVTQIMVWKNVNRRWYHLFFRNLADEIVRNSGEIDVYIMTGESNPASPKVQIAITPSVSWSMYLITIAIVASATILNSFLYPVLASSNLIMVYLLAVTAIALFGKTKLSIFASILSVLAYDFFFVPPFYSFAVSDIEYFFTLLVMLMVTQLISHLAIISRRQAEISRSIENQTSVLYILSRQLATARGVDVILKISARYLSEIFNSDVLILILEQNDLVIRPKETPEKKLDIKEQSIAKWVFDLHLNAGLGTDTLSESDALFLPLLGSKGPIGVLRIAPKNKTIFTSEQMHLLESCANLIALALETDYF